MSEPARADDGPVPFRALDLDAFAATVLHASGTLCAITDRRGDLLVTNEAWDDVFGATAAAELFRPGGSVIDGVAALSGGDPAAHAALLDVLHGRRVRCSVDLHLDDGIDRWISLRLQPSGAPEGHVVVTVFDITALKRAQLGLAERERDLRAVFESAGVGIARLDADLRIVACNPSLPAMFGEPELHRIDLRDLLHPDDVARVVDALRTVQAEGGSGARVETRGLDGAARPFWCALTATNNGPGLTVVVEDVDERRRVELELRRAQRLEAVGRLTSGLAHEIRTPLQFLGDNLRFVERQLEDAGAPVRHAVADALTGVGRIARLADALRIFGAHHEGPVLTDLSALAAHVLAVARVELKSVEVVEQLAEVPLVPATVAELSQAVLALVLEAADDAAGLAPTDRTRRGRVTVATRLGPGRVELEIRSERHPEGRLPPPGMVAGAAIDVARDVLEQGPGVVEADELPLGRAVVIALPLATGVDVRHDEDDRS